VQLTLGERPPDEAALRHAVANTGRGGAVLDVLDGKAAPAPRRCRTETRRRNQAEPGSESEIDTARRLPALVDTEKTTQARALPLSRRPSALYNGSPRYYYGKTYWMIR
jgi:hypothetical protein